MEEYNLPGWRGGCHATLKDSQDEWWWNSHLNQWYKIRLMERKLFL